MCIFLKKDKQKALELLKQKMNGEIKITYATEVFEEEPAVQFNAATLLLPDGKIVILFRGTDDTFTGWIEDVEILTRKGIPSHRLAVAYIDAVADKFDGDIIICGHSKGGNVALYGALHCGEKAKSRLQTVYNNDGPGYHSFDYINSAEYKELLDRHRQYEERMLTLFRLVQDKAVTAPSDGMIDGLDKSILNPLSFDGSVRLALLAANTPYGDDEKEYRNYVGTVTAVSPEGLEMRMNPAAPRSAADIVNTAAEGELADILWQYGEERASRAIARRIVQEREKKPITTTTQLADIICTVLPRKGRQHPATRSFQALRIAVNDELGALEQLLQSGLGLLKSGGRFAVITFHSLEDRAVKRYFEHVTRQEIDRPEWPAPRPNPDYAARPVFRKPVVASEAELAANPRSRSAKLRVIEKL